MLRPPHPVPLSRLPLFPALVSGRWSAQGALRTAGQRALGIADADRHLVLARAEQDWHPGPRVDVPADALAAALSPDLRRLALLHARALELRPLDGDATPKLLAPMEAPAAPALQFDATGHGLWLSGEHPAGHSLQLYAPDSGALLATASVAGVREGFHDLLPHPHASAVIASVSCGQDGTWLTLLARSGTGLEAVGELASENDSFGAADFLTDGESFVGIAANWVRRWSYPGRRLLAEYTLPADVMAGYVGAVHGDSVLLPVEPEDGGEWMLYQLEARTLRLQRRWQLPLRSPDVSSLYVLHGGHLLTDGQVWRLPPELVAAQR
jgi:hypothetical protein